MARGNSSRCDAALRPRARARVARAGGAQGAAKWQGSHAATWAPVWGATCDSVIEGIETINRGIHSPIYTRHFPFFSPCGTMFPHGLTFCR